MAFNNETQVVDLETMEIRDRTPEELAARAAAAGDTTTEDKRPEPVKKEEPAAAKKAEPTEEEVEEEESEEEEVDDKDKKSEDEKEEKTEEEDSEEDKKTEPADKEKEKKEKEKVEEDEPVGVNDFLAEKYAEEYDIKTEEDLDAYLQAAVEVQKENEELRAQIAAKEKEAPKFESEQDQKAFEFLRSFPTDRLSDGYQTLGKIITMDLKTADPKIILEERFILDNPELTRDEALKKFNRDYNRKYVVKAESFDGDESALKEEQEMLAIELKTDVAKARKVLEKKQEELKAKPKEAENKEPQVNAAVQKSIKAIVSEVDDYMQEMNSLIFSLGDKQSEDFIYKLSKDQTKQIHEALKGWVGNPIFYDAKGELNGWKSVEENAIAVARHLFGDDMIEKALKHGKAKGEIKRADEIAKTKPNRVSKVGGDDSKNLTEEQQWDRIAAGKNGKKQLA